ncbi:hypothetical protein [Mucilaginibacter terrae]|uniref:DUF4476 domain-containing protein n=1 Tax=Mucilaginibacter terrae TaxID=1955052 RepID=A0ABU3GUP9_9SPHI|nr:hypothetical protein [Mucilaginibacter terrae]MDT3403504.1 hypothetical protein [Mucilaginibacter terrae]
MRYWLLLVVCFTAIGALAQDKPVIGLVFDKASKERIAKVNVRNLRNGQSVYNTLKADFKINAQPGDALVFSKQNYFSDTVRVPASGDMAVYLKAQSIMLKEVNVRDTVLSAQQKLEQTKRDYTKIYGSLAHRDILSLSPGSGAGISIDALWNMLSRSGRNAEHLRELIEQDYKLNVIDQRFSKKLVQQVTALQEPQLTAFMTRYRPSYYQATTASDYEFINQIKANLKRFQRNPDARYLMPLTTPTP